MPELIYEGILVRIRQKMKEHEIEDVPLQSDSGLIKSFVKSRQIDCLLALHLTYIKAILIFKL